MLRKLVASAVVAVTAAALGNGLAASAVALARPVSSAPSTTLTSTGTSPAAALASLPDGFISVTDETGTLSIAVPEGWTVDTTPRPYGFFDDSLDAEYPTIEATASADDPDGQSSSLFLQTVPAADPEREGLYGDYGVDCPKLNLRTSEYARDGFRRPAQ